MTPSDRARIAAAYGVHPDTIPDPQTIAPGVSNDPVRPIGERTTLAWRRYRLGLKIAAIDKRNGITTEREKRIWVME